jgi:hypothetical protein
MDSQRHGSAPKHLAHIIEYRTTNSALFPRNVTTPVVAATKNISNPYSAPRRCHQNKHTILAHNASTRHFTRSVGTKCLYAKMPKVQQATGIDAPDTLDRRKSRMTWAALIKAVYEVDPLKCAKCGAAMRIVSFIEKATQASVVEKILRHRGLWKEAPPRAPPEPEPYTFEEPALDYGFFDRVCI